MNINDISSFDIIKMIDEHRNNDIQKIIDSDRSVITTPVICDIMGKYIIHYAAAIGSIELLELLKINNVDINVPDKAGETPLSYAATKGQTQTVEWLLNNNALVDAWSDSLMTPLHSAVTFGHLDIVKILLQHGANPNRLHLRLHKTALDLAQTWGHDDIAEVIKEYAGVSTIKPVDWTHEFGGSIIEYVEQTLGKVLPIQLSAITPSQNITLRLGFTKKNKQKVLFTIGNFAHSSPMVELFIFLPIDWNMHNRQDDNYFPCQLLLCLSDMISNGHKFTDGDYISNVDHPELPWPANIDGFVISNNSWGLNKVDDEPDDDTVFLFTLIPLKKTKSKKALESVEKYKNTSIGKLVLKQ